MRIKSEIVLRVTCCCAFALALAACAATSRNIVPLQFEDEVIVAGVRGSSIRFWGDEMPPNSDELVRKRWAQVRTTQTQRVTGGARPTVVMLAISGGGSDGA